MKPTEQKNAKGTDVMLPRGQALPPSTKSQPCPTCGYLVPITFSFRLSDPYARLRHLSYDCPRCHQTLDVGTHTQIHRGLPWT